MNGESVEKAVRDAEANYLADKREESRIQKQYELHEAIQQAKYQVNQNSIFVKRKNPILSNYFSKFYLGFFLLFVI